ncbi:MAG: hypothetical protein AB7H77_06995 [Bdellovibrionales bacterium]
MARGLSADLAAAVAAKRVQPALFAEFLFDSGPVRFWSGLGVITWDGKVWAGGGDLVGVSPYTETQNLEAQNFTFTLSGIEPSLLATALLEDYQGRRCALYFGATSTSAAHVLMEDGGFELLEDGGHLLLENSIIETPYQIFAGIMDTMNFQDDAQSATLTLNAENILIVLTETRTRRFTDEDQKATYPTDRAFEGIAALQDREIIWKGKG